MPLRLEKQILSDIFIVPDTNKIRETTGFRTALEVRNKGRDGLSADCQRKYHGDHLRPNRTNEKHCHYTIVNKQKEYLPLEICSFNAQDLKSKVLDLKDYIVDKDPDNCVITEIWFKEDVKNEEFTSFDKWGGGVSSFQFQ